MFQNLALTSFVDCATSTDAFQTCDAGRVPAHLPSEALHRT